MTNVVYQAYGDSRILYQARFSILTLQHLLESDNADCRIIVYTDNPSLFDRYNVTIRQLSGDTIRQWKGKHDFVHRLKIKMIEDCLDLTGNIFYLDTDTYFRAPPGKLFDSLSKVTSVMFRDEGIISNQNHPLLYKFLRKNSSSLCIPEVNAISMWNAGVIGLHRDNAGLVERVLALNDEIYQSFGRHTVEQFSFSYILQRETSIKSAEAFITHYVGPTRPSVEDKIIALIEDQQYSTDFQSLCKTAYQLDPAARVSVPERTLHEKLVDVFVRQNKSLKRRISRIRQKLNP